jgi:hypothetical protein
MCRDFITASGKDGLTPQVGRLRTAEATVGSFKARATTYR